MKGLLERGANPQAVDKQNVSALHFACGQGRLEAVQFLWSRGVELDSEDPGCHTIRLELNLFEGLEVALSLSGCHVKQHNIGNQTSDEI